MPGAPLRWQDGPAYDRFIGRWSRKLAPQFLAWAHLPAAARVVDVGCGTGALSAALVAAGAGEVVGVDLSPSFVQSAAAAVPRATFKVGDACALEFRAGTFGAAVSGLALNFTPDPARALGEMARVVRPGGPVAVYVWDYAGRMEMLRHFWDAAVELNPDRAGPEDEGVRFTLCHPRPLAKLFEDAGLDEVATAHLDAATAFDGFEDYWSSFQGGEGPAPAYLASLPDDERKRLHARLRERVPPDADGRIMLNARAWAAKGVKP